MQLTIVGCAGSGPGPDSPASCYLVQAPFEDRTFSLVVDLGPGSHGALYRYLDPREVDAYALSHLHPDHCLDLCAAYVAARYSGSAPWPSRPVFGPRGTASRMARAYAVEEGEVEGPERSPTIAEHFAYHDWQPSQPIGPFTVAVARVAHPVEAYALRITETAAGGGSLVFSGDTGPCAALVELARGADLLLVEAAFRERPTNPPDLHLTGRQAAEIGQAAGVSAVVLTHIPPWHDREDVLTEATPHFDGPVSLAMPGAVWSIG